MGKNNSLVYKLVLDVSKAVKSLDNFRNKAVRTTRDANTAMTQMEKGWRSPRSFGMAGMTHLTGSPMGARIKTTAAAGTTTAAADEAAKKLDLLGRVSGKLNTTLGMTSIKAMTLGGSFNTLVTGLMKLNPVVVGLTLMFGKLMERTFHYGNVIAQSKMVLKSIWNSEKRAVKAIQGMREFSRITQHSPEEVVGATTMLAKYNIDPFEKGAYGLAGNKNVMNLMSGLAAMPGMGGKPIGLDRAVNAAIAGRDVRPLKALGPEVLAAYKKAREAGMSGTPEYIKVMLEELAKVPKIMELANEQANQLSTMWSTITGYAEEFFMDISGAGEEKGIVTLWSQLEDILMVIRDEGEKFVIYVGPFLTEFGAALGSAFKFVFDMIRLVWAIVGPILVPAFKVLLKVLEIVFELFKGVLMIVVKLGKMLVEIVLLPFKMLGAMVRVGDVINTILGNLAKIVLGLKIAFMFLGIAMDGTIEKMQKGVGVIIDNIRLIRSEIRRALDDIIKEYEGTLIGTLLQLIFGEDPTGIKKAQKEIEDAFKEGRENARKANPEYQNLTDKELDDLLVKKPTSNIKFQFLPDDYVSLTERASRWAKGRKTQRHQDEIELKRYLPKAPTYNTTVNNYETPRQEFQRLKNITGSTQAERYQMGVPR